MLNEAEQFKLILFFFLFALKNVSKIYIYLLENSVLVCNAAWFILAGTKPQDQKDTYLFIVEFFPNNTATKLLVCCIL